MVSVRLKGCGPLSSHSPSPCGSELIHQSSVHLAVRGGVAAEAGRLEEGVARFQSELLIGLSCRVGNRVGGPPLLSCARPYHPACPGTTAGNSVINRGKPARAVIGLCRTTIRR